MRRYRVMHFDDANGLCQWVVPMGVLSLFAKKERSQKQFILSSKINSLEKYFAGIGAYRQLYL
jgi:hypothetical protein